jgi:propionyl-CoA synthetase
LSRPENGPTNGVHLSPRLKAIHFVTVLPKTRSGKLLRRSIQALAEKRDPGDLTTIADSTALDQVRAAIAAP